VDAGCSLIPPLLRLCEVHSLGDVEETMSDKEKSCPEHEAFGLFGGYLTETIFHLSAVREITEINIEYAELMSECKAEWGLATVGD
jgi:hypothetical protein